MAIGLYRTEGFYSGESFPENGPIAPICPRRLVLRHTHFADTLFRGRYDGCSVNSTDRKFTFHGQVFSRFAKLKVQRLKGEQTHGPISFFLMNPLKRIPRGGIIHGVSQVPGRLGLGVTQLQPVSTWNHVTLAGYSSLRK
jgi:hypothetical protein